MGDHGGLVRTSGQQLASRRPPPPRGPSSRSRTETDRTDRSNKRAASFLFLSPGRGGRKGPPPPVSTSSAARKPTARARAHIGRTSGAHAPQHARSNRAERPPGGEPSSHGGPSREKDPGFPSSTWSSTPRSLPPPLLLSGLIFRGFPPGRSVRSSRGRRGQDTTPSNARRRSLFADPAHRAFPTRSLKPSGTGGGGKTARGKTRDENRRRENQTTQTPADRRREEQEQLGQDQERGGQESSRGTRQTDGSAAAFPLGGAPGKRPRAARALHQQSRFPTSAHISVRGRTPGAPTLGMPGRPVIRPKIRTLAMPEYPIGSRLDRSHTAWSPSVHLHPAAGLLTDQPLTRRHSIPLCRTPPAKRPHKLRRCCSMWPS